MPRRPNKTVRERILQALRRDPWQTYRELAEALGLKSPSVVHYHVKKLQEQGKVRKGDARTHRTIRVHHDTALSAKKSAGGRIRKVQILKQGAAGLDAATWARIEKVVAKAQAREAEGGAAHSKDMVNLYGRAHSLKVNKLG